MLSLSPLSDWQRFLLGILGYLMSHIFAPGPALSLNLLGVQVQAKPETRNHIDP